MNISHHKDIFVLSGGAPSAAVDLVLGLLPTGHLAQWHFGQSLHCQAQHLSPDHFRAHQNRGLTVYTTPDLFQVGLDHEAMAYPTWGRGDFGQPALMIQYADGSQVTDLIYRSHSIIEGKRPLPQMPATRSYETSDALTLEILLVDQVTQVEVTLSYTVFDDLPIVATHARIKNTSMASFDIKRAMSACLRLPKDQWRGMHLSGDWIKERSLVEQNLVPGIAAFGSTRGASGAQHNPFSFLTTPQTTEDWGPAMAMSMVYSGNHHTVVDMDADGHLRWLTGIHDQGFCWQLEPQALFCTPEAIVAYSHQGLGHLSQTLHKLVQQRLTPRPWATKPRPILINNWEATYFDFDETTLLQLAQQAADIGIELFVLDDGWFSSRSSDHRGLGDWRVNTQKLPSGLGGPGGLAQKIKDLGLQFGIWIEPEMVNADVALFKDHPEWVIAHPNRPPAQARNQYVLNLGIGEVVDAIYDQLEAALGDVPLDYIKWDMNRNITDAYSITLGAQGQGELFHRYMLGLYQLFERLQRRFPHVLFEACAAGGGRFDLGMLYYAPQIWTSDNSDPISRLSIQGGTSMAYPPSAMGAHISASPNHQTHRVTSLDLRAHVAFFGMFGLELNLLKLPVGELDHLRRIIHFYKQVRHLPQEGTFYRLLGGFSSCTGTQPTSFMAVEKDGAQALVGWYLPLTSPNAGLSYLKLKGLVPQASYRVQTLDLSEQGSQGQSYVTSSYVATGATLMAVGLLIEPAFNGIVQTQNHSGDGQSRMWLIELDS